jgi:hypothetical protein
LVVLTGGATLWGQAPFALGGTYKMINVNAPGTSLLFPFTGSLDSVDFACSVSGQPGEPSPPTCTVNGALQIGGQTSIPVEIGFSSATSPGEYLVNLTGTDKGGNKATGLGNLWFGDTFTIGKPSSPSSFENTMELVRTSGLSASSGFEVNLDGNFSGTVNFTCAVSNDKPNPPACSVSGPLTISRAIVALHPGADVMTLTVALPGKTVGERRAGRPPWFALTGAGTTLCMLFFVPIRRRTVKRLMSVAMVSMMLLTVACSSVSQALPYPSAAAAAQGLTETDYVVTVTGVDAANKYDVSTTPVLVKVFE